MPLANTLNQKNQKILVEILALKKIQEQSNSKNSPVENSNTDAAKKVQEVKYSEVVKTQKMIGGSNIDESIFKENAEQSTAVVIETLNRHMKV